MKTLQHLIVIALLFTVVAWFSLQGVSEATIRSGRELSVGEEKIVTRQSSPIRATVPPQNAEDKKTAVEPPKGINPLQVALEAGDSCATSQILRSSSLKPQEIYAAILAVVSPSAAMQEIYGPNGPMLAPALAQKVASLQPGTRLLWAIKLANLNYLPVPAATEDLKQAREILQALEKKEPGNAVYPFFRLDVESRMGFTNEQLKETAQEALAGSFFEAHLDETIREVREASWISPALFQAMDFMQSNIVGYYGPVSTLRRVLGTNDHEGVKRLADLMMSKGLRSTESWSRGAYELGQYSAGRDLDPTTTNPEWSQLQGEKNNPPSSVNIPSLTVNDANGMETCDAGPFESAFHEIRNAR